MKKVLFLCLFLSFTKLATAQKDYSEMLDKDNFYTLMAKMSSLLESYETEEAGRFFEQMSQREKFIKEKSLWDLFFSKNYDGNFMSQVNVERIAKIMNKDYQLQFSAWYGEKTILNTTSYILSGNLWNHGTDDVAISSYLKPILKDEVQISYIAYLQKDAYSQEMNREPFILKIDYEKELAEKLKAAKTDEAKALAYKDIARLSYLMGNDANKSLAWAEAAKNLKADKETYLLLSGIYAELGAVKE